jgi:hypothetical protein
VVVTFYTALLLVLGAVLFQVLPTLLPDALATRIGHNSEGLVLALVVAFWVQFARPRLAAGRREWPVTALAAVAMLTVGVLLLVTDLPSRFRTLNEAFLALALLIPYLQLRRPFPRQLPWWCAIVVLLVVVAFNRSTAVTNLAEAFGILLLAPLAFDVVDRGILDPSADPAPHRRWAWYALLVAVPVCFSLFEYHVGLRGLLGEAVRYGVRITEAFVCLLLVQPYFAVVLDRTTGRPQAASRPVPRATVG